jgi:hypothetical protein
MSFEELCQAQIRHLVQRRQMVLATMARDGFLVLGYKDKKFVSGILHTSKYQNLTASLKEADSYTLATVDDQTSREGC